MNQVHTLAGSSKLQQQLCGLKFQLSPLAFFQTNSKQTEVMYNEVAQAAGIFGGPSTCPAIFQAAVESDIPSELLRTHAEDSRKLYEISGM